MQISTFLMVISVRNATTCYSSDVTTVAMSSESLLVILLAMQGIVMNAIVSMYSFVTNAVANTTVAQCTTFYSHYRKSVV